MRERERERERERDLRERDLRQIKNMPLTDKQKEEIEELFFLFDRDFDDSLSAQEFATVRSLLTLSLAALKNKISLSL